MCVCFDAKLCPTLYCDPVDCSPPGSSVHGILQARTLEWLVIFFPTGSSRPRDRTHISGLAVDSLPVSHSLISYCQPTPLPQPQHLKGNFPRQPLGGSTAWCHRNPLSHPRLWMGADTTSNPHDPPPFRSATPNSPQKSGLEKPLPLGIGPRIQE